MVGKLDTTIVFLYLRNREKKEKIPKHRPKSIKRNLFVFFYIFFFVLKKRKIMAFNRDVNFPRGGG